jgi:hypothetical protein
MSSSTTTIPIRKRRIAETRPPCSMAKTHLRPALWRALADIINR